MKRNKIATISVTFILGTVFGISLIAVLSFVKPANSPSPNPTLTAVSTTDANRFFHNYYDKAVPNNQKLKSFPVDRLQLEVMDTLAKNKNLVGFNIYLAKNDKAENISIIVGVTTTGEDAATGSLAKIYKTESRKTEPCPPLCGADSPITK
jgi:hypothetical protein